MSARFVGLADAVAASLATIAGSDYTPVRAYVPDWTEKALASLQCVVVPSGDETEIGDRNGMGEAITIDVGFAHRLDAKTRDEIDALTVIVDAAFRHLSPHGTGKSLTVSGTTWRSMRAAYKAIFDPDKLAAKSDGDASGAFLSVFSITYRAMT